MKINITDYIKKELDGDKTAKQIVYFLIHLISAKDEGVTSITQPNENKEHIVDVEITINGHQMDFLEFVEHIFKQYDEQVEKATKEKIEEIRTGFTDKFNNLLTQFMHKEGLISNEEYHEKILW